VGAPSLQGRPSKSKVRSILPILPVRNIQKIQSPWLDAYPELIRAKRRLDREAHRPAVKVAGEGEIGVGDPLVDEVVAYVSNLHVPVGGELQVTERQADIVGSHAGGIQIAGRVVDGLKIQIVTDGETADDGFKVFKS